jgi:hypothetical protein
MVLHNDRVQEMVYRLGDPACELSDEDRRVASWVLYMSWAMVEWKSLMLRGEEDCIGTDRMWQEALLEFYTEASSCVRGEHDFCDDLDRVQNPVGVCLRCGLERTSTPPLSKTPENPREKCGISTVRIDGNCNE